MILKAEIEGVYAAPTVMGFSPVVVIMCEDGRLLPIFIGIPEAIAIHSALKNHIPPRPMTHDLIVEIVDRLRASVEKVVIDDIVDSTFYARIFLKIDGREVEVDARPSDSIAIALRSNAPIFIEEKVLDEAGSLKEIPKEYIDFEDFV